MAENTISGLAKDTVGKDPFPAAEEGTVLIAPDAATTGIYVAPVSDPSGKHGPFPWVSNGLLPAAGDGCLLIRGLGERWALVWATGSAIGGDS